MVRHLNNVHPQNFNAAELDPFLKHGGHLLADERRVAQEARLVASGPVVKLRARRPHHQKALILQVSLVSLHSIMRQ